MVSVEIPCFSEVCGLTDRVVRSNRQLSYSQPSIHVTLITVNSLYLLTNSYSPHIANENVNYVKC